MPHISRRLPLTASEGPKRQGRTSDDEYSHEHDCLTLVQVRRCALLHVTVRDELGDILRAADEDGQPVVQAWCGFGFGFGLGLVRVRVKG